MRLPLSALIVFVALSAGAQQHKRAPRTPFAEEPAGIVQRDMAKTGSYRQIDFWLNYSNILDTTAVYRFRFDGQGRVTESANWDYDDESKKENLPPEFHAFQSRINEGKLVRYGYGSPGDRPDTVTVYAIQPAHSPLVAYTAAIEAFRPGGALEQYGERSGSDRTSRDGDAAMRKALGRFLDSIARISEDVLIPESKNVYTYDADGNILSETETPDNRVMRYDYRYYPDGAVRVRRGVYRMSGESGTENYFSGQEEHFTYMPDGQLATVTLYVAERDTGDLAQESHLKSIQTTYYNGAGKPDSVVFRDDNKITVQRTTYANGHPRSFTIHSRYIRSTAPADTLSHARYTYRDTLLTETVTTQYYDGKPSSRTQETIHYNALDQQLEALRYEQDLPRNDELPKVTQSLYFYGNAAEDAQTAARRGQEEAVARKWDAAREERHRRERERERARQPRQDKPVVYQDVGGIDPNLIAEPTTSPGIAEAAPVPGKGAPLVFTYAEQMPEFPGDIHKYLDSAMRYPARARKESIEGRVVVRFVVQPDGSITDATVTRGVDKDLDAEALRLVRAMPRWRPGKQNGRAVPVLFNLPILFKLLE